MVKVKDLKNLKKLGVFAGGVLFGTAGIAVLASKDAKKLYTQCTAAVLRGKDSVMKTTATLKENCGDIYADAKDINDARYEAEAAPGRSSGVLSEERPGREERGGRRAHRKRDS